MSVSASWYVNQQLNNVIVKGIAYIKPLCSGNYQCIAAHIGTTPPPLDCPLWPKSALGGDRRLMYNAGAGPGAALWRISAYLMAARWCRMSPPPADRLSNGTRLLRKVTEGHRQATDAHRETGGRSPTTWCTDGGRTPGHLAPDSAGNRSCSGDVFGGVNFVYYLYWSRGRSNSTYGTFIWCDYLQFYC